ncbi:MAG TPA: glycoside hydrolase family 9 protein [Gemmatimonadaceae bacterium]|nr:glycoside hydrolase family 9 protein [Gemmatimonadaceae bacterium]
MPEMAGRRVKLRTGNRNMSLLHQLPLARMLALVLAPALAAPPLAAQDVPAPAPARADNQVTYIRVNQLGYLPAGMKVAVACSLEKREIRSFKVVDAKGRTVLGPRRTTDEGPFAACASTHRLDFSAVRVPGAYRIVADGVESPPVFVRRDAYAGAADTLLYYMRQQRSGWNPVFLDPVHTKDGIVVDHPTMAGDTVRVSGGWADASDYLQYVTTSANATFVMLMAYRDNPRKFADAFDARGRPGANGVPDILDEARHGLEWLSRMFPDDTTMFNQIGDDRDHSFLDLPTTDSSDYGWGKGGPRPVYPCTGKPQGLFQYKNRSTGYASTAGKYAAAFALGARLLAKTDSSFAQSLRRKAAAAYLLGKRYPGVCQTAPGKAPYFYEEDNWADDMELGAVQLHQLAGDAWYLEDAVEYARREPTTPWMGADTAKHYQYYPWHNNGHYEIWRVSRAATRKEMAEYYRFGLRAVAKRAGNGFRMGVPFIWCSNNLIASLATQAYLYRKMTGDTQFLEMETAALDWLFGTNPWGVSMVIGLPQAGVWPRDPHSVVAKQVGLQLTGGLVDGPVYRSIYQNLKGISLTRDDPYAPFNTGFIVFHDDFGDYSTNEPIMDGTANLTYLLSALAPDYPAPRPARPAARRARPDTSGAAPRPARP